MAQTVIVALIVVAAAGWLIYALVGRAPTSGCSCETAASCPYADARPCALGSRDAPSPAKATDKSGDAGGT